MIEQLPLLLVPVLRIDEEVELSGLRAVVHRRAVDDETGVDRGLDGDVDEMPGRRVDLVDGDGVIAPVPRRDEVHERAAELEPVPDVHVVQIAVGEVLELVAGEVVDGQSPQLVGSDDGAERGVGRMDPDAGIVGRIAGMRDGIGLGRGDDAHGLRACRSPGQGRAECQSEQRDAQRTVRDRSDRRSHGARHGRLRAGETGPLASVIGISQRLPFEDTESAAGLPSTI